MANGTSVFRDGSPAPAVVDGQRGQRPRGVLRADLRPILFIVGPLALAIGVGWWWYSTSGYVSTDDAYIEAGKTILTTDVSGIVAAVDVTDNQRVKAGQVLFTLDDQPFRIAVAKATAQLGLARNEVEAMKAQYRQAQEEIRLAQVNQQFAQRDFGRRNSLFKSKVVAQDTLDQSEHALSSSEAQLANARQRLAGAAASLGGDIELPTDQHPRVLAAKAQLAQAERDLSHTVVRAPQDGIVSNVPTLQPGMYLGAGMPAFDLVGTNDVWIEANPKESQLTWVKPGQPVKISVDTYPDTDWRGKVCSISPASGSEFALLPAQNTSGNWVKVVQRIPIRICIDQDPDKPVLRAGMSTEVEIDTGHRPKILGFLADLFGHSGAGNG